MKYALVGILLAVIAFASFRYVRLSAENKAFEAAWARIEAEDLPGSTSYEWRPGLFGASGSMEVSDCGLTDDELSLFRNVPVNALDLSDNQITDEGLKTLQAIATLTSLNVTGNEGITAEGIAAFNGARPDCTVTH